jgi:starch synthase
MSPVVALLPWGQVIEDYLDAIGLDLEGFLHELDGGWMFGYIDALAAQGIATAIVWPSRRVRKPQRRVHVRTGAPVWFIPPTRTWRLLRRAVDDPYARHPAGAAPERALPRRLLAAAAHVVLPWVATPVRALSRVLRAEHTSVLLCQEYEEARFDTCIALRRVLRVPVYAVFQGGILQRTPLERFTRRRAIGAASGLVIGASSEARRVETRYEVSPDRIGVVRNPLPIDQWPIGDRASARAALDIPADAGVVSWHGRVQIAQKGLDVLLDAWEEVTRTRPERDLILLLTGTGQDAAALHADIERRQPRGVRWLDAFVLDRDAIQLRLASADVAVLSSRAEGFPVAPLEAMASGRALVATAVPGIMDIAPNGERDGVIIVPSGDAGALASALGALLDDSDRAAAAGAAGRARIAAEFSVEVVGAQLAAILGLRDPSRSPRDGDPTSVRSVKQVGRRALTKVARRAGRFLGVTDLFATSDELRRRVQMLEEEQLRSQQARAVWVTCTYLAATPIPEESLISVVLPTHNRAALLARAVDSVVAQSYRNWELIVVDDGSDDDTAKVMSAFTDPRITVLYEDHRGQAATRNTGLDKASGDFVVYLDDDNLMYEHWLRGVAWAFTVHPEAELMIGARLIDDEYRGRHLEAGGPPHLSFTSALDRAALAQDNQADIMQLAHRRSLPERFDADDQPFEDWGFLTRSAQRTDPLCFPALAGIYTTTTPGRLMDSDTEVLDRQVQWLRDKFR